MKSPLPSGEGQGEGHRPLWKTGVLWLLLRMRGSKDGARRGSWGSALALFAYAAGFSLAYVRIPAGLGALILFGCVQATMLGVGLQRKAPTSAR